jgi:3-dehydroquinate dehydratase-1/3-dehydroquinate dehydratase/shikimate dehydrogenase
MPCSRSQSRSFAGASAVPCPLLFTNRPTWEGGLCSKPESERLEPLREAAGQQAAFVDLELRTSMQYREQLLDEIRGSQTRLIISHHDFEKTPDSAALLRILQQQVDSGAHIGKIVTLAHSYLDVLRVLHLQCEAKSRDFPLIAFCMGEEGKLSRIITLLLGGFMTYAALDEHQATAPGQLSVNQLKKAMAELSDRHASN